MPGKYFPAFMVCGRGPRRKAKAFVGLEVPAVGLKEPKVSQCLPTPLQSHGTYSGFAEGSPALAKSEAFTVLGQHQGLDPGFATSA